MAARGNARTLPRWTERLHCRRGCRSPAPPNAARFKLAGIPPLPAGMARVEVSFVVGADGILRVAAREVHTGLEARIEVKPTCGLFDAEIQRILQESIDHAEADVTQRLLIEARLAPTRGEKSTAATQAQRRHQEKAHRCARGTAALFATELYFIRSMVQPSFAPNLRQFLERFPAIDKKATEHDDRLTDLKTACRGPFWAVRSAPNFEAALQDVSARRRLRR